MNSLALSGQVTVVTGSAGGIGFAIAKRFAAAGSKLVITSRDQLRGSNAEAELRSMGGELCFVQADMSSEAEAQRVIDTALDRFGRVDVLVNNAGPSGDDFGLSMIHQLPTEQLEKTLRVGFYGPLWCSQRVLPIMLQQQSGVIINISAIAAARAIPAMGAYAIAKAAMDALGRQIANDYAAKGIRCNSLLVGTVRPDATDRSTLPDDFDHAALDTAIGRTTMLGHVGHYDDVAEAALFLASPSSKYITGAGLPVEGGALAKLQYPDYSDVLN